MSRIAQFVREQSSLATMMVLTCLIMSGNGLIAPVLPIYGSEFGVGGFLIGMLSSLFGVGRLLANFPTGLATRRLGHKPLLVFGPLLAAVGAVAACLITSFPLLLLCRLIQGLGAGIYMTVSATTILAISKPGHRAHTVSYQQGAMLIGVSIGPAMGGVLAAHFGYLAPFWAYTIVNLIAAAVAFLTYREPPEEEPARRDGQAPASFSAILARPSFLAICAMAFGIFFSRSGIMNQSVPLIANQSFGESLDTIGSFLALNAGISFVTIPLIGPTVQRLGATRVNVCAVIASVTGLLLVGLSGNAVLFWLGVTLSSVGNGFNAAAVSSSIGDAVPRAFLGPAVGFQRAVGDVGVILAPIAIGLIYDHTGTGHAGGVLFVALVMLLAGATMLFGRSRETA